MLRECEGYGTGGSISDGDVVGRRHDTLDSLQTMMVVVRSAMGTSPAVIMALSTRTAHSAHRSLLTLCAALREP